MGIVVQNHGQILLECLNIALVQLGFIDREEFYRRLENKYHLDSNSLDENFHAFHLAIKEIFGVEHYRIERELVKTLHRRTKDGCYNITDEITIFSIMIKEFTADSEREIAKIQAKLDASLKKTGEKQEHRRQRGHRT